MKSRRIRKCPQCGRLFEFIIDTHPRRGAGFESDRALGTDQGPEKCEKCTAKTTDTSPGREARMKKTTDTSFGREAQMTRRRANG